MMNSSGQKAKFKHISTYEVLANAGEILQNYLKFNLFIKRIDLQKTA